MAERKNRPNAYSAVDIRATISSAVSIALHPSGEMDVIFDTSDSPHPQKRQRIRFSPFAASHFLTAIHEAVKAGRIIFDDDEGEQNHLH